VREFLRVLGAGGRVCASVFTSIERNPAAHALADAVDRHFGGDASRAKRSEHSLSDPQELQALFEAAGFANVRLSTATHAIRFASVDEWVEIQFTATPLAGLLPDRDRTERDAIVDLVRADVAAAMKKFATADGFVFPQEVHVALADS
jgi:dihydrodipicolinate reductase